LFRFFQHLCSIVVFLFPCSTTLVGAAAVSDWDFYTSDRDCLIMTTEKKKGNLSYPSTFFISYNSASNSLGAGVQNYEWLLKKRDTTVYFSIDSKENKSIDVSLVNNLMIVKKSDFLKKLEQPFRDGVVTKLLNSKRKAIAQFSLMGFTATFEDFKACVSRNKPKTAKTFNTNSKQNKSSSNVNQQTNETLKLFLKAAILFAIAKGDIPVSGFSDDAGGVSYKRSRSGVLGSDGSSWKSDGRSITNSNGLSWRYGSSSSSGLSSSSGCTSDLSCGVGSKCVKEPYDYRGVCMKSVDRYGIQKLTMPSSDGIGPRYNDGGCRFLTDCPIGFKCDRNYKVCVNR